jgi:hypothetical protein
MPALRFVSREATVRGGQNFRQELLVHSRCLAVSGLRAYRVRPCELTRTLSPSLWLDAAPIVRDGLVAAIDITANAPASARIATPDAVAIDLARRERLGLWLLDVLISFSLSVIARCS